MSDFRALAAASNSLRALLLDRMDPPAGIAASALAVTIGTPRAEGPATGWPVNEAPRINVFLYQVTENQFLKNHDARTSAGSYGRPPLALNLHYLLTAYGAAGEDARTLDESTAQQLLGSAMRVMHDYAVLTPGLASVREPSGVPLLAPALLDADTGLKIVLDPLGTEELTRIWTSLTIPMRTSAAYSVSSVEIASTTGRSYPRPVGEPPAAGPRISLGTFATPSLTSVAVRRPGDPAGSSRAVPYARIGDTLLLTGTNFGTRPVTVFLGQLALTVTSSGGTQLETVIPDDAQLQPGVLSLRVGIPGPGGSGSVVRSNAAVLMLTPAVTAITTTAPVGVRVTGTRLTAPGVETGTLIGPVMIPASAYTTATGTAIDFIPGDRFPHPAVGAYVTGDLGAFTQPADPPVLLVSLAGSPATIALAGRPGSWAELAASLQSALRASGLPGTAGMRVGYGAGRIAVLGAGAGTPLEIGGTDAAALHLDAGAMRRAYRSGAIDPAYLPGHGPLSGAAALRVTRNGTAADLAFTGTGQQEAAELAPLLGAALGTGPAAFARLAAVALGDQLLVLDTGTDAVLGFDEVPGSDTAARLGLRVPYPVRVRVNGAEAIGGPGTVVLP